jgi:hypothetical protein
MALTNAQRMTALQTIFGCSDFAQSSPVPSGTPLATILPGVTLAQVLTAIATALGTTEDSALTTALTSLTSILNVQLTAAEATVTSLQAQIAAF